MFTFTFEDQESIDRMASILQHLYLEDMTTEIRALSDALDSVATEGGEQSMVHTLYADIGVETEIDGFGIMLVK